MFLSALPFLTQSVMWHYLPAVLLTFSCSVSIGAMCALLLEFQDPLLALDSNKVVLCGAVLLVLVTVEQLGNSQTFLRLGRLGFPANAICTLLLGFVPLTVIGIVLLVSRLYR